MQVLNVYKFGEATKESTGKVKYFDLKSSIYCKDDF